MSAIMIIGDIESAIVDRLTKKGLKARTFEICDADGIENMVCPALNIAFWDGSFKNANLSGSKLQMTALYYLTIVVQNAQSEQARRHAVYPMVLSAVSLISGWRPVDIDGKTIPDTGYVSARRLRKSYETKTRIAFTAELSVPLTIECGSEEDAEEILKIAIDYMLKPGDDDSDAQDMIEFD